MATYKVIQDIEAEDKLVGPLTLKQFIYGGVAALCLYICFLGLTKHFPYIMVIFLPIALVSGFFAFPFGRDQPTETWALAKIRFLFKPRVRIWDQTGAKELVSITAPKKVEVNYTDGLSQTEVHSRLKALADTIDSRGWAVKNVNVNLYSQPSQLMQSTGTDRLIDPNSLPQQVPTVDIAASDDIMDEHASPVAQHFEQMIQASEQAHRQQIIQQVQNASQGKPASVTPPDNFWFMNQPTAATPVPTGYATFQNSQVVAPGASEDSLPVHAAKATPEEEALVKKLEAQAATESATSYGHLRTIQPLSAKSSAPVPTQPPKPAAPVTPVPDPAILGLANNNDRSVASLAKEINETRRKEPPADEVVISLH